MVKYETGKCNLVYNSNFAHQWMQTYIECAKFGVIKHNEKNLF